MPTPPAWTESFPIRAYNVTPHGVASPLALCDFLQETAGNHAERLGVSMESLLDNGQAWVLAFLRLKVDRYPDWHDTLTIETWPSGLDRLYAMREFVLSDDEGECARATSAWLVIDTKRRRPLRPPAKLYDIDTPDRPPALDVDRAKMDVPDTSPEHERTFRVRYHDLDLNRHVNNVRYVEWATETLPAEWLDTHGLRDLTLEFRAETTAGDLVRGTAHRVEHDANIRATTGETGTSHRFRHHLLQAEENRTLALAQTVWTPRDA
jgi:acyl-ACP thioesterase